MLVNPKLNQKVKLHYRDIARQITPHHGKTGIVLIPGKGKPRNHCVLTDDGITVIVPCGNLNAV